MLFGKKPPKPDLIMLIGLDFLSYDKKSCPSHLKDCFKFLHELLKKGDVPVAILHVPQTQQQPPLADILAASLGNPLPANLLIIEDNSVDAMLAKLVRDLGIEAQVEAIDTMLSRQGADEEEQLPDEPESPAIAERQKAFAETIR